VPSQVTARDRWKAWDDFLESKPDTGFMQSSWWADFRATVGYEHFGAVLKSGGAVVGGAMVQKYCYAPNQAFYYIQDGPALPEDDAAAGEVFDAILETIGERRQTEEQRISHLRIEPRWQRLPDFVRGFQAIPECMDDYGEPRNTLWVDLRPSEETILAQMKPKGRYNIRLASRHGVSVVEDTSEQGLADFLRLYKRMAIRHEIGGKPPGYFRSLVSGLVSVQKGAIFFAEYKGRRLAAAIVVYFGRRATYFFGGSLVTDRRVMAPYLLHFEIMRRAKAMGCEWYDLWGVSPESEPDHCWQNFSVFKRKFGGVDVRLVPTLDLVYDAAAYDQYAALAAGTVGKNIIAQP